MAEFELSAHAKSMMVKRKISNDWISRTLNTPDKKQRGNDGNMHYTKSIREREGRVLHIVMNTDVQPNKVVTLFFDRRLAKQK